MLCVGGGGALTRSRKYLDVDGHDVEFHVVKEQSARERARVEAVRALAVVAQPDVRVRRLLAVVPRHLQTALRRIQRRLDHGRRRQIRMVAGQRWTTIANSYIVKVNVHAENHR